MIVLSSALSGPRTKPAIKAKWVGIRPAGYLSQIPPPLPVLPQDYFTSGSTYMRNAATNSATLVKQAKWPPSMAA